MRSHSTHIGETGAFGGGVGGGGEGGGVSSSSSLPSLSIYILRNEDVAAVHLDRRSWNFRQVDVAGDADVAEVDVDRVLWAQADLHKTSSCGYYDAVCGVSLFLQGLLVAHWVQPVFERSLRQIHLSNSPANNFRSTGLRLLTNLIMSSVPLIILNPGSSQPYPSSGAGRQLQFPAQGSLRT